VQLALLCATSFRHHDSPRARYTAIISLRPDKEPKEIFDDGCQLKLYLVRLITRLSYAHSACPSSKPGALGE
jgi:hypothetical protein